MTSFDIPWLQINTQLSKGSCGRWYQRWMFLRTDKMMYKEIYSAPSVYRPPFYRQSRLSPKFSSVPISPITNTPLYFSWRLIKLQIWLRIKSTNVITRKVTTGNYSNQNTWSPVLTLNYEINDRVRWPVLTFHDYRLIIISYAKENPKLT
jgi:hypothetical protein